MLKNVFATLAVIGFTSLTAISAVEANEVRQAEAHIVAIKQDIGALQMQAGHLYQQVDKAYRNLEWHSRMEVEKRVQMDWSRCARPESQQAWDYCASLYSDMQEHARLKHHWGMVFQSAKANHLAAVRKLDELNGASHWWTNRLAMLQQHQRRIAWQQHQPAQPVNSL